MPRSKENEIINGPARAKETQTVRQAYFRARSRDISFSVDSTRGKPSPPDIGLGAALSEYLRRGCGIDRKTGGLAGKFRLSIASAILE